MKKIVVVEKGGSGLHLFESKHEGLDIHNNLNGQLIVIDVLVDATGRDRKVETLAVFNEWAYWSVLLDDEKEE